MSTKELSLKATIRSKPTSPATPTRERTTRRPSQALSRVQFSAVAGLIDASAATVSAGVAGLVFNGLFYHTLAGVGPSLLFGLLVALSFALTNLLRHDYETTAYLDFSGHMRRIVLVWNIAFLTALAVVFMSKQAVLFSRGSIMLFYGVGLVVVGACRALLVSKVKARAARGDLAAVRIVLVGNESEIRAFTTRYAPWSCGVDVVASFALRGAETLDDDLALAAASARVLRPDDIYILLPWSETATIDTCVTAFEKVPAAIHLGPQEALDRFSGVRVSRIGKIYSLNLVRRPLATMDLLVKRTLDLVIGVPLLLGLAPLLVAVAVAIKLDSPGPVLFLQRRYGFNQETFRIVKFRSMSVAEDDRGVKSATRNDPRVTRVGRFIRRCNIDELPQLLNVIRGEMSLVGPRPHALIHNQHYERSIAAYARRHNVKPGITGWAQVNGLRGEVTSEDIMRRRLEHDLHYIDHWSISLDLRCLAATLLSRKAFSNAY